MGMASEQYVRSFRMTGEAFTRIARGFMLDDRPERAYRFVTQGLGGEGNLVAVAEGILDGHKCLVGDESGMDLVDDVSEDAAQYREDIQYLYAGRFESHGQWYRPYRKVTSWGEDDASYAFKKVGGMGVGYSTEAYCQKAAWASARSLFYGQDGDRTFAACTDGRSSDSLNILWERCRMRPFWWPILRSPAQALRDALARGRTLGETGYCQRSGGMSDPSPVRLARLGFRPSPEERVQRQAEQDREDAAREAAWQKKRVEITARVLDQAAGDVFPLTFGGRTVQVPRAPFTCWSLWRTALRHLMPAWDIVSPSGLKLGNDDPYHTDWLLGAGLDRSEAYGKELIEAAYEHQSKVQEQVGAFQCAVLVDAGCVHGRVGKEIVVLPDLGVEHVDKVLRARAIITQTGGALAHLAQVALERSVTIMRHPDALRLYPKGSTLTLDPSQGTIQVSTLRVEDDHE